MSLEEQRKILDGLKINILVAQKFCKECAEIWDMYGEDASTISFYDRTDSIGDVLMIMTMQLSKLSEEIDPPTPDIKTGE